MAGLVSRERKVDDYLVSARQPIRNHREAFALDHQHRDHYGTRENSFRESSTRVRPSTLRQDMEEYNRSKEKIETSLL